MFVILGGNGIQGKAITNFLLNNTKEDITIIDKTPPENESSGVDYLIDELGHEDFCSYGEDAIFINCLPTEFNLEITKECIKNNISLIDLGGETNIVEKQFELCNNYKNSTIIPDCGLAPGLVSILAAKYEREGFKSVEAFCGGVPKRPVAPLFYSKTFYVGGVIKEYNGLALEVVNGQVRKIPTLTEPELIYIPNFGVMEADITSGGTSLFPNHTKLNTFRYKTLRYAGHWNYIKKNILNRTNSVELLNGMLNETNKDNPDVIILSFRLDGEIWKHFFWEYNEFSAMSQATGFVVGAVAKHLSEGKIKKGAVRVDELNGDDILYDINMNYKSSHEQTTIYEATL
jgi:saccharopine dehydrogenase-like NADP-dependent oxidoreductase